MKNVTIACSQPPSSHETIKMLEIRTDYNEQRRRNECLLIHVVIENEMENDLALNITKK